MKSHKDVAAQVSRETGLRRVDVDEVLRCFANVLVAHVGQGDSVKLSSAGTFKLKVVKAHEKKCYRKGREVKEKKIAQKGYIVFEQSSSTARRLELLMKLSEGL